MTKTVKIIADFNYSNEMLQVSFSDNGQGFDYLEIKKESKGFVSNNDNCFAF